MISEVWEQWTKTGEQITSQLNHRKFNEVYLVENKENGVRGILKQLTKTSQNQHLWPLLRQEASISFTQKGLPQTLYFKESEDEISLIRSFQEGIPLDKYWEEVQPKNRLNFIHNLFEKLSPLFKILEANGIVHCDIKPTNIIVSGKAEDPEVKLIDFGMAISREKPVERKTLFALGYSAPELILNKLSLVDQTTDLFSLGITAWQLFAGKLPLMHANPGIMTNLQITHPLPENNSIPKQLRPVLAKMCFKHSFQLPPNLMKDKEVNEALKNAMGQRYQSLEAILKAMSETKPGNSILSWLKPHN